MNIVTAIFLVMKISYPEENYTFPLKENFPNVTSDFEEDQIYIPAHVLVNETGGEWQSNVIIKLCLIAGCIHKRGKQG